MSYTIPECQGRVGWLGGGDNGEIKKGEMVVEVEEGMVESLGWYRLATLDRKRFTRQIFYPETLANGYFTTKIPE